MQRKELKDDLRELLRKHNLAAVAIIGLDEDGDVHSGFRINIASHYRHCQINWHQQLSTYTRIFAKEIQP